MVEGQVNQEPVNAPEQKGSPLRLLAVAYVDPALKNTDKGKIVSHFISSFNELTKYKAGMSDKTYNTVDDVRNNPELIQLARLGAALDMPYSKSTTDFTEDFEPVDETQKNKDTVQLATEVLTIGDETELQAQVKRIAQIKHAIRTPITRIIPTLEMAKDVDDPAMGARFVSIISRSTVDLERILISEADKFLDLLAAGDIPIDEIIEMIQTKTTDRIDKDNFEYDFDDRLKNSIIWGSRRELNTFLNDALQNIERKKHDQGITDPLNVVVGVNDLGEYVDLMVADNGGPVPAHIVRDGFGEGVGSNKTGEHISMADHAKTAKELGGVLFAENKMRGDELFAEIHLHLSKPETAEFIEPK